jgi:hypothetical protein
MKRLAFLILGLLVSLNAYSGVRDIGNGGAGVMVNGKPVLLDLYEMGLTSGFIEKQLASADEYMTAAQAVTALTVNEQIILAKKLTEIHNVSPRLAIFLALALREYVWAVIDVNLNVIPEASPLNIQTVQLANRLGSVIRLQKSYWDMMDESNRIALVLHEVAYAYAPVNLLNAEFHPDGGVVPTDGAAAIEKARNLVFKQDSIPVRELIGILFLPNSEATLRLRQSVVRDQWGTLMGFSMIDGDLVTTFDHLRVNGQPVERTQPTLCEELLQLNAGKVGTIDLYFDAVSEKVVGENYKSASGRQKSLNAVLTYKRPMKATLNLAGQDVFTCAEQVKNLLK